MSNLWTKEGLAARVALIDRVLLAYKDGQGVADIAASEGVPPHSVRQALAHGGAKARSRGIPKGARYGRKVPLSDRKKIVAYFDEFGNLAATGRKFGVSREAVRLLVLNDGGYTSA